MKRSRHALEDWPEIERRMERASQVILFTDFDGTLVRTARTPGEVLMFLERMLAAVP